MTETTIPDATMHEYGDGARIYLMPVEFERNLPAPARAVASDYEHRIYNLKINGQTWKLDGGAPKRLTPAHSEQRLSFNLRMDEHRWFKASVTRTFVGGRGARVRLDIAAYFKPEAAGGR